MSVFRSGGFGQAGALCSFFKLPEQGMTQFEPLSRGSTFLIRTLNPRLRQRFHLVAPGHVTHPFRFPSIYPSDNYDWLRFVSEKDVLNKLQIRSAGGKVEKEYKLAQKVHLHPEGADLSLLHFQNGEDEVDYLEQMFHKGESHTSGGNSCVPVLELLESTLEDQELYLFGHEFVPNEENGEDLFPVRFPAEVLPSSENPWLQKLFQESPVERVFVSTPAPTVEGMCGGPAIVAKKRIHLGKEILVPTNIVAGVIEAKIQLKDKNLQKNFPCIAVCISSQVLLRFVEGVERKLLNVL